MDIIIKARAPVLSFLVLLVGVSSTEARIPERLNFENIGLNQTISIQFQSDQQDPTMLAGAYKVFSLDSESPLILVQFTAKANQSRDVQDCYVLIVYFANDILPYHRPKDIEITKWLLCLETTTSGLKEWRLRFPVVGRDYVIDDLTVYELELEQVHTSRKKP